MKVNSLSNKRIAAATLVTAGDSLKQNACPIQRHEEAHGAGFLYSYRECG